MWITIQLSDVFSRLTQPEVSALQTKVLGPGQTDPIGEEIVGALQEVRGYVGNAPRNLPLGSGLSIPSELKGAALSLIVVRAASRLPTKLMLTDERTRAASEAIALLGRVADAKFAVARPSADQLDKIESVGAVYPAYDSTRRRAFRNQFGV